jgi:hypothetical protein
MEKALQACFVQQSSKLQSYLAEKSVLGLAKGVQSMEGIKG